METYSVKQQNEQQDQVAICTLSYIWFSAQRHFGTTKTLTQGSPYVMLCNSVRKESTAWLKWNPRSSAKIETSVRREWQLNIFFLNKGVVIHKTVQYYNSKAAPFVVLTVYKNAGVRPSSPLWSGFLLRGPHDPDEGGRHPSRLLETNKGNPECW